MDFKLLAASCIAGLLTIGYLPPAFSSDLDADSEDASTRLKHLSSKSKSKIDAESNSESESSESEEEEESEEAKEIDPELDDHQRKAQVSASEEFSRDDSGPKPDPEMYYKRALEFMNAGKYQFALDDLNRVLKINPRHIQASFAKGVLYQATGNDKFAARRYLDVLQRNPEMDRARINLAALHRKHKYYAGAEEQLKQVIHHNFYSFEGHYNLANTYLEAGKHEEALKEYKVCQKLKPGNAMVHNNMGVIFLERKYAEDAAAEFKRAANLEPANQTFTKNLSLAQKMIKDKASTSKPKQGTLM